MSYSTSGETSPNYLEILSRLHSVLMPRTYLEIGTQKGTSLRLARCAAIAIDPNFDLDQGVVERKPACMLFEMSSDRFFADYDPSALFGKPVDFSFLDGMHLYEFLLRDFMHVESCCKTNSIIAIHDMIPRNLEMAARIPSPGAAWTGDVWKVGLILKKYRPDLKILCLDADPTGLLLVTKLNPLSLLLRERYFSIIEEYQSLSLGDFGLQRFRSEISVVPSTLLANTDAVLARYWL